jgi:uncharacterized membrane protein
VTLPKSPQRRPFLDWCRGLAVLCMIEHHHFDAFMPDAFHGSALDRLFRFLGGVAAPTFLFLAGLSLTLMMEGRLARSATRREAAESAARRALLILAGAYAFRFQEWALAFGASPAWTMLRIDVLNCIGVALLMVALLWGAGRSTLARAALFLTAAALAVGLAPLLAHAELSGWPRHLADYVNGRSPRALFPLFPWVGFALVGAAVGLFFAQARRAADPKRAEARVVIGLSVACGALWAATRAIDALPFQLYPQLEWWVNSPAYFLLRTCSEAWLLAACWFAEKLARPLWARLSANRLSNFTDPLAKLGQHSLIIYWVHVELVYGRWTWRARGQLSLAQAAAGLLALLVSMVALAYLVEPATEWIRSLQWIRTLRARREVKPVLAP